MSEPTGPGMDPEEYAAALDRLLDGLEADGPADAQVRADTDSIARALGLIGDALAAEGGGVTAAAGAAGGATVVQMSSWRSKLNPRVLAAAASLLVVLGIGIPLTMSSTGGSDSDDAATAAGAPESAVDAAQGAPAPAAAPMADGAYGTDTSAGTVAGAAGATDTGAPATGGTGAERDAAALSESQAADPAAPTADEAQSKAGAKNAGADAFADAVACARAIFVGTVTAVRPEPDGSHFTVTFLVEDWIVPSSGAVTASYRIYGSTANSPGLDENVLAGQRRLFIVPGSEEERISAYREKDWAETKKQIKAARDERAGEGC